jgi:hypothetical protein
VWSAQSTYTGTALWYIDLYERTTGGTSINDDDVMMIAPYDGELHRIAVHSEDAGGPGSTVMGFHINKNTTATETQTETVAEGVTKMFDFSSSTFSAGDRLTFSCNPTNSGEPWWFTFYMTLSPP